MNWFGKKERCRLSETKEVQILYQEEMARILNTAICSGVGSIHSSGEHFLDGEKVLSRVFSEEGVENLRGVGLRPEDIKVFKSLTYLLAQCKRLDSRKENLDYVRILFRPQHPITPMTADAYQEVVNSFCECITPNS